MKYKMFLVLSVIFILTYRKWWFCQATNKTHPVLFLSEISHAILICLNGEYQDISGYRRGWLVNSSPVKNVVQQVSKHDWLHSSDSWESVCGSTSLVDSLNLTLSTTTITTGHEEGHSFRDEEDESAEAGDTQWLDTRPNAHTWWGQRRAWESF